MNLKKAKSGKFNVTLPIDSFPVGKVRLSVNTLNNKETVVAVKRTIKEFPYQKNMQAYRHKDDATIP
jgi:hypothetical protein